MRKTLIAITMILSILFCSCTNAVQQAAKTETGETNSVASSDLLKEYGLTELPFPDMEGYFQLQCIKWLSDESMLVMIDDTSINKTQEHLTTRVYYTCFDKNEPILVYDGPFLGINLDIRFRNLENDELLISGRDRALRVNLKNNKLIEILEYPQGSEEADIYYDEKKIVYTNEEGLFVDTIPSSNPVLLCKQIFTETEKRVPGEPKWSSNGQLLCYAVWSYGPFKYIFVTPEGEEVFEYNIEADGYGYWFKDSQQFASISLGESFGMIPYIYCIDAENKKVIQIEKSGDLSIKNAPTKNELLYIHQGSHLSEELQGFPHTLFRYNIKSKEEIALTPEFINIYSPTVSPSGKIAFIGHQNKSEEDKIYAINNID